MVDSKPPRVGILASATVLAALLLGALVVGASLPIDDFWLTLASGRQLLDGAPLEHAVPLSWMPVIEGALNPQWGAQIALAAGGSLGYALGVNAALIGAALVVTAVHARLRAGLPAAALAMVAVTAVLAPHLLARAQSFSILLAGVAFLMLSWRPVPRWLPLGYGVLMLAWANLHGAFVIGQLAAGVYLIGALWRMRRSRGDEAPPAWRTMGLTFVVAMIAPLANPAGLSLVAYAYAQPGLDVVRSISVEWQPAWPWVPVATLFWLLAAAVVVARVFRRGGIRLEEAMLLAGLAVLAAGSLRQIPWFALAAAPVLAADVQAALDHRSRLRRLVGEPPGWLRGNSLAVIVAAGLLALIAVQPLRPGLPQAVGRITPDAPVELAAHLERRLAPGALERVLNEQVWGGYLSYVLGDQVETAMDGRLEIRDRATWARYFDLLHGIGDPAAALHAEGVSWVAVREDREQLLAALAAAGWTVEARGPEGVLLRAP